MTEGGTHPRYPWLYHMDPYSYVLLGDEVAGGDCVDITLGTVTAIYLESVELSTGDQVPVADLVLLRRAES